MTITLNETEIDFLLSLFETITVKPTAPDSLRIVQAIKSITEKLRPSASS